MAKKTQKHPSYMRRCVATVSQEKDLSTAFAICTSAMQKAGYLEPESRVQTKAGKKRARQYAGRKDFKKKEADYERALELGRDESLSFSDYFLKYVEENTDERLN